MPKWRVCQCQYSIISAPRATKAQAAWRHWPSKAGKLFEDPPMAPALVSVIRNGACLDAYIRSAAEEQAPRTRGRPALRRDAGAGHRQRVLHRVVRIAGGDVEGRGEVRVVDCRPFVGDAGGDELVVSGVLADDVGLPGDELGRQLGLERTPGEVVLGLVVAVRGPQVGPGAELVRPVDQTPRLVEGLDVP